MDDIARLGEELAGLTWVSDLGQGMIIGFHEVHFLGYLIEWAKLVEHELLGFDLLGGNSRHILVSSGRICKGASAEVFLEMGVEAVEEGFEGCIFSALRNSGDLGSSRLVVALDEVLCDLHSCILLFRT